MKELLAKYLKAMEDIENREEYYDWEVNHLDADKLLCELLDELGFEQVTSVFERLGKYYA